MLNPEISRLIAASLRDDIEPLVEQLRADPRCFDHLFTDEAWDDPEVAAWYENHGATAPVTEPSTEPGPEPIIEPEA